jgi:hypothetical protein
MASTGSAKGKATQTFEEYEEAMRRVAACPHASGSNELVNPVMTLDQALQNVHLYAQDTAEAKPNSLSIYEYTEYDRLYDDFRNDSMKVSLVLHTVICYNSSRPHYPVSHVL